jgi:hypothetical protein
MREEIQSDDTSQKYVIDEKVIQNKLEEKLLPNQQNLTPQEESARKARIQKAISMYSFIRDSVVSRPKESALEQEWKMSSNKKDNQKYQEAQRKITTRLEWYADSWEKDRLPMVPTGDTDYTYLNYTATGEETPGRNWSKLHAESATIQKAWMEFYSVAIKVAEGKSVDPFYEYIQQYYDKIKEEDLDSAHKFVVETTKRLYNMFREDDVEPILLKQVGRVADEAARNPRSFMQRKIIKAPLWQEDEASMILNELYKKGIIVKKGIYGLKKLLKEFGARQLDIFRKQGWVYIIGALGLMGGGILKDAQRYMSLNPNSS